MRVAKMCRAIGHIACSIGHSLPSLLRTGCRGEEEGHAVSDMMGAATVTGESGNGASSRADAL